MCHATSVAISSVGNWQLDTRLMVPQEAYSFSCFATPFVPVKTRAMKQITSCEVGHRPVREARFYMEDGAQKRRRRRQTRRPSAFENTIDDLTMKRLGRGSMYYGERPDFVEDEQPDNDDFLKPDAVLVTGATGRTGQWIALGLMNQGFNVRCLTRKFGSAEKIFGPSGSNLDVFEGDITNFEQVRDAVEDSVAVVCASGAPWWLPDGHSKVDLRGVQNLIRAAKMTNSVQRFVLISSADERSARGAMKRKAEQVVIESGIPFVIFRATSLSNEEGGMRRILLSAEVGTDGGSGTLSRVDLAQSVCQSLVYDRGVSQLRNEDPSGDFDFPSSVIHVENGREPYVPDKRFWKREFNRISDQAREDEPQMTAP